MTGKSEESVASQYDVIVLGGGAAGLMCAFTAAQRGRRVLVLEKANKIGKKILMSGGGRCNFTNQVIDADNYISGNPHFCKSALSRYTQWDFIALVEQYGIEYEERKHGQLFCVHSAKEILSMLLQECKSAGAIVKTHCDIKSIEVAKNSGADKSAPDTPDTLYRVNLQQGHSQSSLDCQSLVIATGALSIPSLGGSGMGYEIARQFSLPVTELQAGLVPFMFSDATKLICERLSGVSLAVEVSCGKHVFAENLLFTHRGISGPAILQISNYWQPGDQILINLLPEINAAEWLLKEKHQQSSIRLQSLLNQALVKGLVNELQSLWWPDSVDKPLAEFSDKQLTAVGTKLNNWVLKPSSTEGYRTAEVTLGGVDTDCISSRTMQAKDHPGLYFIGEILDVTGHLGGYNFQWAWSSGYSAGVVA